MKTVLFLCTGNYYRSRFAEALFNALAGHARLDWRADSAGLLTAFNPGNIGPISLEALRELAMRNVVLAPPLRHPRQVREADLAGAARVIALNESEHRPLLADQFPAWADRAAYWRVPDLGDAPPSESLTTIERGIAALIQELLSEPG